MKTRQVTERIGENMGPIDTEFDWRSIGWDQEGSFNPALTQGCWDALLALNEAIHSGRKMQVLLYGNWHDVLDIGMYDGWPHWKPYPSVCIATTAFGAEWHGFEDITATREKP